MQHDGDRKRILVVSVGLVLFLASISCNLPNLDFSEDVSDLEGTSTPTSEIGDHTPTHTLMPTDTPEPTATITPIPFGPTMTPFAPVVDSLVSLSEDGPWLVYRARKELTGPSSLVSLFIANEDGSGRRLLGPGTIPVSEVVVSPAGDRFAYITRDDEDDPHLVIRLVPGGEIETDIALVSSDIKSVISEQIGLKDQILTAVGSARSLSWSPSGHYLAFVAALEGANTDIYRFDTWSNNIRQLTTNSLNAYLPSWSPDGDWVLHLKGESIGGLTDMDMDGLWVVSPDGTETKRLYDSNGGSDILVAWVDGTTFYTTRYTSKGHYDLIRRKDDGSTPNTVYRGPLSSLDSMSFDDLMSAVAFNIQPADPVAEAGTSPGIYLASLSTGAVDLVLPGDWMSVEWWPGKGVFLANGAEGTVFIRRTGEVVKRMDDIVDPVALSPAGGWMVSYGEAGARVYTHIGVFIQQVYDGPVAEVVWQPGDEGFFLEVYQVENPVIGHQLYYLDMSEWDMHLVDLDTRGGYFWMEKPLEIP
jgi:Tol biopolymer transport system component